MSETAFVDPRESAVAELHAAYSANQLRVLVGNGLSIGAGLPAWETLNRRLLYRLIDSDAQQGNLWASALESQVELIRDRVYEVIGRDAAADFVKFGKPELFNEALAHALYQGLGPGDLSPTYAHKQLASARGKAAIATTNFDPLIELAIEQSENSDAAWESFRALPSAEGPRPGTVEHLHGWVDYDGTTGGSLILTEGDYFDLARDENHIANRRLESLFTTPGATLVLGMSMADINIRRILYVLSRQPPHHRVRVSLVLKQEEPLVDIYTQKYWEQRKIRLLFIEDYEEIPGLLRDIQWSPAGPQMLPGWIAASLGWRRQQRPDELLFDDDWQTFAHGALKTLLRQMRRLFAVRTEERSHISLFLPLETAGGSVRLSLIATSRRSRVGSDARTFAEERSLDIREGREQGLAAIAFTRGVQRESLHGDGGLDFNFSSEMLRTWVNEEGYRDWRSVLAVPLIATPDRIPVAVLTLTSNLPEPFWTNFPTEQFGEELLEWMRRTTRWILRPSPRDFDRLDASVAL